MDSQFNRSIESAMQTNRCLDFYLWHSVCLAYRRQTKGKNVYLDLSNIANKSLCLTFMCVLKEKKMNVIRLKIYGEQMREITASLGIWKAS